MEVQGTLCSQVLKEVLPILMCIFTLNWLTLTPEIYITKIMECGGPRGATWAIMLSSPTKISRSKGCPFQHRLRPACFMGREMGLNFTVFFLKKGYLFYDGYVPILKNRLGSDIGTSTLNNPNSHLRPKLFLWHILTYTSVCIGKIIVEHMCGKV